MVPKLVNYVEINERIENKGINQMAQSYPATRIGMIRPILADRAGKMMPIGYTPPQKCFTQSRGSS